MIQIKIHIFNRWNDFLIHLFFHSIWLLSLLLFKPSIYHGLHANVRHQTVNIKISTDVNLCLMCDSCHPKWPFYMPWKRFSVKICFFPNWLTSFCVSFSNQAPEPTRGRRPVQRRPTVSVELSIDSSMIEETEVYGWFK